MTRSQWAAIGGGTLLLLVAAVAFQRESSQEFAEVPDSGVGADVWAAPSPPPTSAPMVAPRIEDDPDVKEAVLRWGSTFGVPAGDGGLQAVHGPNGEPVALNTVPGPFGFAMFDGQLPSQIGNQTEVLGLETMIGQMDLPYPLVDVEQIYTEVMTVSGLRFAKGNAASARGARFIAHAAMASDGTPLKRMLLLTPLEGDASETRVFVSIARERAPDAGARMITAVMPIPEVAVRPLANTIRDQGRVQENLMYDVEAWSFGDTRRWLTDRLETLGFKLDANALPASGTATQVSEMWRREEGQLTVQLSEGEAAAGAYRTSVRMMWVHP